MSVSEILNELPKLPPEEFQLVLERVLEIQDGASFNASPELLAAIDEVDATPEDQDISSEEVLKRIRSWNSK